MKRLLTHIMISLGLLLVLTSLVCQAPPAHSQVVDEDEVSAIIRPLVDNGLYVGIAVGLIDRNGQAMYSFAMVRRVENLRTTVRWFLL